MSNLLKGYWLSVDEDNERVVDSNELSKIKIQEEEERRARLLAALRDAEEAAKQADEDGFSEGIPAESIDVLMGENPLPPQESNPEMDLLNEEYEAVSEELENARAELESIRTEADDILNDAAKEAERIKNEAFESAKNEGYSAGYNEGMAEIEKMRAELEADSEAMQEAYQQAINELEPLFVEKITGIYERIFKVDLSNYHNIVKNLLIDAINGSDGAKNIIIHIAREDYSHIIGQKDDILTETGMMSDYVEFIQDATLSQGGCIVETDNGIYDCSLGTELEELKKKLMILSYR